MGLRLAPTLEFMTGMKPGNDQVTAAPSTTSEGTQIIVCRGRPQCRKADWPCSFCFCIGVEDTWISARFCRGSCGDEISAENDFSQEGSRSLASIPLTLASLHAARIGSGTFSRKTILPLRLGISG